MLAQLILTKGWSRRGELKWIEPERKLLPVPVSPVSRMEASVEANLRRLLRTALKFSLSAMIWLKL